jgi:hypothetical protein
MSYPKEVQAIFALTLSLLEQDEQFERNLLRELRELCGNDLWDEQTKISEVIDHMIAPKEPTNG